MSGEPIIYGRPRYLAPLLTIVMIAAIVGAIIGYQTYGRAGVASNAAVLGNRAVTEQLTRLVKRYEADNAAHRERNELAHACIAQLLEQVLHRDGDVTFAATNACAEWTAAGSVPPITEPPTTTTTTHPRRRTTTTARHRRQPPTTTSTTHASSTRPPTTNPCPTGTIPVAHVCRPISGP